MSKAKTIPWFLTLQAFYAASLNQAEIDAWEYFLRDMKTNDAEISSAVRMAADESMKPEEWKVTLRDLIKWLRMFRARKAAETRENEIKQKTAAFVSEWREKLSRGADKDDIASAITVFVERENPADQCRAFNKIWQEVTSMTEIGRRHSVTRASIFWSRKNERATDFI